MCYNIVPTRRLDRPDDVYVQQCCFPPTATCCARVLCICSTSNLRRLGPGTVGVATHHDGMSGTERQSVADDYAQRISESHFEVEAGVAMALQKLSGYKGEVL